MKPTTSISHGLKFHAPRMCGRMVRVDAGATPQPIDFAVAGIPAEDTA